MFEQFFETFSDSTLYFMMGSIGTVLFLIKLVLLMIGADDGSDFDLDADGGVDGHSAGFGLFSLLSIMSFLMGAGWVGLACREQWEMGPVVAAIVASGFGFGLMVISSFGMYQMKRMETSGNYKIEECVGQVARVYVSIPAKGEGSGQVQIKVGGGQKVLGAVSEGEGIDSFEAVTVVEVRGDGMLIVNAVDKG